MNSNTGLIPIWWKAHKDNRSQLNVKIVHDVRQTAVT